METGTQGLQRGGRTLAQVVSGATLEQLGAAARMLHPTVIRSPLLQGEAQDHRQVRLKAENLQPLGSFKIRGGSVVLGMLANQDLERGVATASAGNFAQGLGLAARHAGVPVTVHVPDTAAGVKLAATEALGATIVRHSFSDWWGIMSSRETGRDDGVFIHPVCEAGVILGNATIGLELAEQWPELDTVVVPFGGGGLITGIALAFRALQRPVRVVACEAETSTPLASALSAGRPTRVERRPSFIDGIGSTGVLEDMWPLLEELVDDVIVVSLTDAQRALCRLAIRDHLVVEGAGAVAAAAAASARSGGRNVAAVLSGGNIDQAVLCSILSDTGGDRSRTG